VTRTAGSSSARVLKSRDCRAVTFKKTELTEMRLSRSRICALAILALFVGAGAGCSLIGKVRAKNELNEAAKAYKEGHFEDAEQHARKALAFDPDNRTATIFVARIIHQQYKPGVDAPDNIQKARDAVEAYKRVLQMDPKSEEAFQAISYLYAAIKDDDNLRQWISTRANDANETSEKRAEAYAILAGKDWDCSYKVTELPEVKQVATEGKVNYVKPKDPKDFDNIQKCVTRGLEEAETSIKYDPNNEKAWSYKTNLLVEAAKIATMNGETDKSAQYEKQAEVARKRDSELVEAERKRQEALEAAQASPTP
jgi:tetratricopeptide (TPR) repeat protein